VVLNLFGTVTPSAETINKTYPFSFLNNKVKIPKRLRTTATNKRKIKIFLKCVALATAPFWLVVRRQTLKLEEYKINVLLYNITGILLILLLKYLSIVVRFRGKDLIVLHFRTT
jgi:hypothetical protein